MDAIYRWTNYLFVGWCVLALAFAASAYGTQFKGEEDEIIWVMARFAACFAWPLSLLYIRRDRSNYLRRLMSDTSPEAGPRSTAAPAAPARATSGDASAGASPTMVFHSADERFEDAEPLRRAQDKVTHWARLAFKVDALLAGMYLASSLPLMAGWDTSAERETAPILTVLCLVAGLANVGMAWSRWRRRPQFSMSDRALGVSVHATMTELLNSLRMIQLPFVGPALAGLSAAWLLISALTLPQWRVLSGALLASLVLLIDGLLITTSGSVSATSVLLLLAAGLHLASLAWLDRRAQAGGGPALLVLRLFDADASASFLFGRLLRVWGWFGNWFTVADVALLAYQNRTLSNHTFYAMAATFLVSAGIMASTAIPALANALAHLPAGLNSHLVLLSVLALGIAAHLQVQRLLLRSRCIASTAMLDRVMGRLGRRPRHLDFLHKGIYLPCYDNTWKPSVATLVERAAAVLMDLRGFDPSRAGCRYEIDYLLDHVPLRRVVFLVQSARDADVVADSVSDAMQTLCAGSPNRANQGGPIQVFQIATQGDDDIAGLTALLLRAAEAAPTAQRAGAPAAST